MGLSDGVVRADWAKERTIDEIQILIQWSEVDQVYVVMLPEWKLGRWRSLPGALQRFAPTACLVRQDLNDLSIHLKGCFIIELTNFFNFPRLCITSHPQCF
jgi:hypothetical protein